MKHSNIAKGSIRSGSLQTPHLLPMLNIAKAAFVPASLFAALLIGAGDALKLAAWASPAAAPVVAQVPAGATVIYVNPLTGSDAGGAGSSAAAPYRTITYALQQASPGTVIQLASGSYTEQTGEVFPLVIKSGVTLRGDESDKGAKIAIIGGGAYTSPTFALQNVTIRADKDSQASGIGVTNPNTRGTALWIESANATISNSTFSNSKREGIFVSGTANPRIEGNIFTKNSGNGISIARQSTGEVRGNVFDNTGTGIVVTETAAPLLVDNRIVQNRDGVVVSNSATPVLRNNIIQGNRENGVVAISDAKPDLGTAESPGNNLIRNNGTYDLANLNRTYTISAVGNDIDAKKIAGSVNFTGVAIAGKFADIQGHWAQAYIEALIAQNIISGYPDGTFRPNAPVTRAEFTAMVTKAFTPAPARPAITFKDVRSNFWAFNAIQTAYRGTFVTGYPDGNFRPDRRIPKLEVLVALVSGLNLKNSNTSVLSVYSDAGQIPNWAGTAIAGATIKELVVNYPTPSQLSPSRDASRAEVAAFIYQSLVSAGRAPAISSPYLVRNPQAQR